MTELLQAAVAPPNLVPTGLLVFVLLYWLLVIGGLATTESLDLHLDVDHHVGHGHLGADGGLGVEWLNNVLVFFNLGRVPLMFWLSFVALPLWVGSILANYYLHNTTSWLLGLGLLVPLLLGSLIVAKVLTQPFVRLFAALEKDHGDPGAQAVGKVCTVLLPTTHDRLGQARVTLPDGSTLMLNVRAASATGTLAKGAQALVIDFDDDRRCYLIEPYAAG